MSLTLRSVTARAERCRPFGRTQELAQRAVIFRMGAFLVSYGKQVQANERLILDGVNGSSTSVPGMAKLDPDVAAWILGVFGSAVAGAATPVALRAAAKQLAKANTGTALANLSGAALERAILAFFCRGSRAAGGGGMDVCWVTNPGKRPPMACMQLERSGSAPPAATLLRRDVRQQHSSD